MLPDPDPRRNLWKSRLAYIPRDVGTSIELHETFEQFGASH